MNARYVVVYFLFLYVNAFIFKKINHSDVLENLTHVTVIILQRT